MKADYYSIFIPPLCCQIMMVSMLVPGCYILCSWLALVVAFSKPGQNFYYYRYYNGGYTHGSYIPIVG